MVIDELATQFSAYAGPINYRRMTHTRAAKNYSHYFENLSTPTVFVLFIHSFFHF